MFCLKFVLISSTLTALITSWAVYDLLYGKGLRLGPTTTPVPTIEDSYWGPGEPKKSNEKITNFNINISDDVLLDLKKRLQSTRIKAEPLEGVAQEYGFNLDLLKKVVKYWKDDYDWKTREVFLNKFEQFTTNVQGLDVHFLHVKPEGVPPGCVVVPLLLLHGWPGSVREFYDIIPLLIRPKDGIAFEVVAPSLPGFAWSSPASKPGLGPPQMAVVFNNLMIRLGFEKYYIQGGDWGSQIGSHMSLLFPYRVQGLHINMCASMSTRTNLALMIASIAPGYFMDERSIQANYPILQKIQDKLQETGYLHIQATKPDTLGPGLDDSPAALAAWVLEKFSTATNKHFRQLPNAGLTDLDHLIDNLMIYWTSLGGMTSAVRIYAENYIKSNRDMGMDNRAITVPTWCAKFPNEIFYQPDWILRHRYVNLIGSTDMPIGGHFAAMEQPQLLEEDIRLAIKNFRKRQ